MSDILENIEFGEPWKIPQKLVVAVPILRRNYNERKYKLLQEIEDKVEIKDSGYIDKAILKNQSNTPVFVRKGTLLKGQTQERGVTFGIIVLPEKEKEIEVRCVHASKPIRAGATFNPSKHLAPRHVMTAWFSKAPSQSYTWSMVTRATASLSRLSESPASMPLYGFDDLVGALETSKFKEEVEKVLEKIPADLENQVGIAIIDIKGVVGVEIFDHPDSWRALSKSIIRQYADVLIEASDLFEIKKEKAIEALMNFLAEIRKAEKEKVYQDENTETFLIKSEKIAGEYTTLNGKTIHLIVSRIEKQGSKSETLPRTRERIRLLDEIRSALDQINEDPWSKYSKQPWNEWFRRKGSYTLLDTISETPKTWKDLERRLDLSPRTLSRRLREAEELGLIYRKPRLTNGRMTYRLTEKGKKTLQYAKTYLEE